MNDVAIIGAGWAGLAAAVTLSQHNISVTVYESAAQIGGRARSVNSNNLMLDNGQHLMIGAYQQTLKLLKIIGLDEADVLHRYPQQLQFFDLTSQRSVFDLKLPKLPAPLHLLMGMLSCKAMSKKERLISLLRFNHLLNKKIKQDISVSEWLSAAGLPQILQDRLLLPLCLAAMTTHPQQASAKSFQSVLQKTFSGSARHTDFLIPKIDLSQLFPLAAKAFIEAHGGKVMTSARCQSLIIKHDHIQAVEINHIAQEHSHIILATPPSVTKKLLQSCSQTQAIAEKIKRLEYESVITVYLQYDKSCQLNLPMLGLLNGTTQWLFDRRICHQAGLMAAVISASGEHDAWDNPTLAASVAAEIAQLFPHWPKPNDIQIIREKRATLGCHVDVDKIRPTTQTSIKSLSLCGDYVLFEDKNSPGLPSTLEAATHSGVKCAQLLLGNN